MKIALVTEDGKTISQHFGRAPFYLIATIDDGQITSREMREMLGHAHFAGEPHEAETPGQPHGFGPAEQDRHVRMAQVIADCQVLICRGMGMGAYESMKELGIRPMVTDISGIDEALAAFIGGWLVDHTERLH